MAWEFPRKILWYNLTVIIRKFTEIYFIITKIHFIKHAILSRWIVGRFSNERSSCCLIKSYKYVFVSKAYAVL